MFDMNTLIIGTLKFITIIAFIIVAVNFCIKVKKKLDDTSIGGPSTESIIWGYKLSIVSLIGIFLIIVYIFNMEAIYRPKQGINVQNPPQAMTSSLAPKEIVKEIKPDHAAVFEASREQTELGKEKFKALKP